MHALKMLLHLACMGKIPSRAFLRILKYISLPRNIMENSISAGTKRICFDSSWQSEREKNNNYCFRRVLSAEVIDDQPISDDYVYSERGIDERASPGHCEGRTWIAQQYRLPRCV